MTITPPLSSLYFEVSWDGSTVAFSEVSGLMAEAEVIEYRAGDDQTGTVQKVPGLRKAGNVTLKRALSSSSDTGMFDWYNSIQAGGVDRREVTVTLMNEEQNAAMNWVLSRAWPVKIEGAGLNATGNEIAIESLEFACEVMRVELP